MCASLHAHSGDTRGGLADCSSLDEHEAWWTHAGDTGQPIAEYTGWIYKLLGLCMFSPTYIQVYQQRAEILLNWGSTSGQSLTNHQARASPRNIGIKIKTGAKGKNWVETSAVVQFEGDKFCRTGSVKSLNNGKTNNNSAGNETTSGEDQKFKNPAYII